MKTFFGIPGTPPVVTVASPEGARQLDGTFGWGKNAVHGGDLAKAILVEHFGNDGDATKYYRRFLWRTLAGFDGAKPFTLTTDEIDAVMTDIREGDKDAARARSQVVGERPPIVSEGGIGVGGAAISPIRIKS